MKKITFTKELKKIWDVKVSCKALSIDFEFDAHDIRVLTIIVKTEIN